MPCSILSMDIGSHPTLQDQHSETPNPAAADTASLIMGLTGHVTGSSLQISGYCTRVQRDGTEVKHEIL